MFKFTVVTSIVTQQTLTHFILSLLIFNFRVIHTVRSLERNWDRNPAASRFLYEISLNHEEDEFRILTSEFSKSNHKKLMIARESRIEERELIKTSKVIFFSTLRRLIYSQTLIIFSFGNLQNSLNLNLNFSESYGKDLRKNIWIFQIFISVRSLWDEKLIIWHNRCFYYPNRHESRESLSPGYWQIWIINVFSVSQNIIHIRKWDPTFQQLSIIRWISMIFIPIQQCQQF